MTADEPGVLVGARKECPLIVGVGEGEQFLASAIPAFLRETRNVKLVNDGEIVAIRREGVEFLDASGKPLERETIEVDWDAETAEKGGYDTFMLKEIHEQPDAVAETIADRTPGDHVELPDTDLSDDLLAGIRRVVIVACGTSYHAGLVGRYAIEEWARVPVEMDIASEYRYRNPVVGPDDLVIGISQSGETADTLAAMRLAREAGATVLAVTNVMGSQATRDSDAVLFTRAGLEIGVAATKTFVSQVAAMYLLGLKLAAVRGALPDDQIARLIGELKQLPHLMTELLERVDEPVRKIADHWKDTRLLPLPRPPRRPARGARGRAEAEGDLLHPDRRLRGRRDEARADRAARPVHAGRVHRHRHADPRQGPVERGRGQGARRARDRRRDRRLRPASTSRPTRSSACRRATGCSSRSSRSCRSSCSRTTSRRRAA